MKRKSSLLICIAAFSLTVSIGGCSQKEIEDTEDIELISEDPIEIISFIFNQDYGLEYDVSWWTGVDYFYDVTVEVGLYESLVSDIELARLVKEEDSYSSGLVFRSETLNYQSSNYLYNEYSYLDDGLLYKYEEDENQYSLTDLKLDNDSQFRYSVSFFLSDLMTGIETYIDERYLLGLIYEGYDVSSELIKTDNSLKASLKYTKEEESEKESSLDCCLFELVFNKEGKLISTIQDFIYYSTYYEQDENGQMYTYPVTSVFIREGTLYEGIAPLAPSWVEDNFNL